MKHSYTWMDILAVVIFVIAFIYVWTIYPILPDQVPQHFNASGEVTTWTGKVSLILLLILHIIMVKLMIFLNIFLVSKQKDPFEAIKFINIPFIEKEKLTREQAEVVRSYSQLMISSLNLIISVMFAYITYSVIQTALANQTNLSDLFYLYILLAIIVPFYITYVTIKKTKQMEEKA